MKYRYYIFIFIILSSLSFYNPFDLISPQIAKFIFYLFCVIGVIYAYKKGISLQKINYPKLAYKTIIYGIFLSAFIAFIIHNQPIITSIIAIMPYLCGYSVLYILLKFNIPKEKVEHLIWVLCLIGIITYIINLITLPHIVFGNEKEEYDTSRGFVRISIRSLEFIVLYLFYGIEQWNLNKKNKYLYIIIITLIFIILSVVRQYIMLSFILGLLLFFKRSSLGKKITITALCIIFYGIILPQIPIYQKIISVSQEQINRSKYEQEDIRITAWKFYVDKAQLNNCTRIFGNGIPSIGNSEWGNRFLRTVDIQYGGNGCSASDVGWAGFYWYFGILPTISLLFLLIKGAVRSHKKGKYYLSYWCVFIILTSIASGPILYHYQIISIMTILYLIYGKEKKIHRSYNPQLQQ